MRTRLFPRPTTPPTPDHPARIHLPRGVGAEDVRRFLRRLRRSPALHWIAAATLALLTFDAVQDQRAELARRIDALGRTTPVVVLRAAHPAGDLIGPGDVRVQLVPQSMAADGAVGRLRRSRRLRVAVGRGEVLTEARLASGDLSALAAAIPPGWRAVAVPMPVGGLRLQAGDRVDLLTIDPDGRSTRVVSDAIALAAGESSATIAVPRRSTGPVADAILAATLTVALAGPE